MGREAQIAQFRSNTPGPMDSSERKFIFNVHGVAGIGKTFLVYQLAHPAQEARWLTVYTDEAIYDLPGVMAAIASELMYISTKFHSTEIPCCSRQPRL